MFERKRYIFAVVVDAERVSRASLARLLYRRRDWRLPPRNRFTLNVSAPTAVSHEYNTVAYAFGTRNIAYTM